MNPGLLTLLSIALLLFGIAFLRLPIGLLLAAIGFAGYAVLDSLETATVMLGNECWGTFSSSALTVVPLFIFMGQICFHSGVSRRLYQAVASWLGHKRGGVAAATILACGAFAAICGSNTATAATMSVVSLPEMKRYNYAPAFAAGTIAAGTTLGAVIPPSVVAIVLGVQTGLSIKQLFAGGILPGLLLLLLFLITIAGLGAIRPDLMPAGNKAGPRERLNSLPGLLEALFLFLLVVGGLCRGLFTPAEAGAAGSALALFLGAVRRGLSWKDLGKAALETMVISAMIFLLLTGAGCYGKFLALSRTPFLVAEWVGGLSLSPALIMLLIFSICLIGGMVMDALALLLITVPIFFPLVKTLGYDPMWFCLVLLVVTTMGAITPPVGASAYVVASMGRLDPGAVFRGTLPFIPACLICVGLMFLFPGLVVLLPGLSR